LVTIALVDIVAAPGARRSLLLLRLQIRGIWAQSRWLLGAVSGVVLSGIGARTVAGHAVIVGYERCSGGLLLP